MILFETLRFTQGDELNIYHSERSEESRFKRNFTIHSLSFYMSNPRIFRGFKLISLKPHSAEQTNNLSCCGAFVFKELKGYFFFHAPGSFPLAVS